MKTVLSVYSITVGVVMIATWALLWNNGGIPEMVNEPWELVMHLTAEFTTAALLIVSGVGLLAGQHWASRINVFSSGMLVYTLIQTPGYYLQHNGTIFVLMFAVSFLITVWLSPAFKLQRRTP